MKKKTLYILIATISLTISSCNNSSSNNISVPPKIDLLESTYYLKFGISKSDVKVIKEYYQTEEGKTHLIDLEAKLGDDQMMKALHKKWIEYILSEKEFHGPGLELRINKIVNSIKNKYSNLTQVEAEQILKNEGYNSKMIDTILSSYKKSGGKLKEE
jgi:hypothetical protein